MKAALSSAILLALLGAISIVRPQQSDIPKGFTAPTADFDYVKREVVIPMRDGVKLFTAIIVPKGARNAPILLTRTPYNASDRAQRSRSPHMVAALPLF